jgi:hypothetical protein
MEERQAPQNVKIVTTSQALGFIQKLIATIDSRQKINRADLCIYGMTEAKLFENMKTILMDSPVSQAKSVWKRLAAEVQYPIIVRDGEEIDLAFIGKMGIEPATIGRAFLSHYRLADVDYASGLSARYVHMDSEVSGALCRMLESLTVPQALEILRAMNHRSLMFMCRFELCDHDSGEELQEFLQAFEFGLDVSSDYPLLQWIQRHDTPLFKELVDECFDTEKKEIAIEFRRLQDRNASARSENADEDVLDDVLGDSFEDLDALYGDEDDGLADGFEGGQESEEDDD